MNRRIALFGVFTAFALIVSYIESLIPFTIGIPGVKLGLPNAVIVAALFLLGTKETWLLNTVRVLAGGFLFGNLYSIIYSLAGAWLSFLVMAGLKKRKSVSVIGISIAGGVFHNAGQLFVAVLVLQTKSIFLYLPVLLVAGVVTGGLIGILDKELLERVPAQLFN